MPRNKCNSLGIATKWNTMEIPDTLCMLVSKLPNGITDRKNRKGLMLKRSLIIKEKGEATRSMIHLQHISTIINLKHKINAYLAVTSTIWTTVRNK